MKKVEEFYLDIHYAKLKWMSFQSGYIQSLWDDATQNQLNALSNLAPGNYDLEAHMIACQTFFRIELEPIIDAMRNCLVLKTEHMNKDQFTVCPFNRLTLNNKK